MPIKHVITKIGPNRWRQEIDKVNGTINIVYHSATHINNVTFTDTTPTTYASQLSFIMQNIEAGNWIVVRKCKAKRLVGR